MNKKIKILSLILAIVLVLGTVLTSCGKQVWGPIEIAEGEVSNNGGMVVEKGDYYYFVNGYNSTEDDNTFGTPIQGSICRIKKDFSGESEIVVPKIVYSSLTVGGIFIFGDYVYYGTPNDQKDKTGKVQNTYLDFNCSKLDGSSTVRLTTTNTLSTGYRFVEVDGRVLLNFVKGDTVVEMDVTNGKKGKENVIIKNISSAVFDDSGYIYYTKTLYVDDDNTRSSYSYNGLFRTSPDGKETDQLFADGRDLYSTTYTLVQCYKNAVYYTKTINGVDKGLYVLNSTGSIEAQKASEKCLTETKPSDFIPYDYENGILVIENGIVKQVKVLNNSRTIVSPTEKSFSVLVIENGKLYLTSSENTTDPEVEIQDDRQDTSLYIYRVDMPDENDEPITDEDIINNLYFLRKVDLSYKGIEFVNDDIFFFTKESENVDGLYQYVMDKNGNLQSIR